MSSSRDDVAAVCQNHSIIINATLSWCLDEGRVKKIHNKQLTDKDRIEEGKSKTHSHDDLHNNKQRHKLWKNSLTEEEEEEEEEETLVEEEEEEANKREQP